MTRLTPAQRRLWRTLAEPDHFDNGLPVADIRGVASSKTLAGLERRGLAVVMADRAFLVTQP